MWGRVRRPILALLIIPALVGLIALAWSAGWWTARASVVADDSGARALRSEPGADSTASATVEARPEADHVANPRRGPADLDRSSSLPAGVAPVVELTPEAVGAHTYLGVSTYPNSPAIAQRFSLPSRPGLVVVQVDANGPAARAGVHVNDVITAINGQTIQDESTYYQVLSQTPPNGTLAVTIVRGSQTLTVAVPLGTAPRSGG
jgi:membrane-associated protease RseP (regulator of RpoE activity)